MMPDLVQSLLNTLNQIIEDNPIIAVAFSGFAIAIFGALIALFRHIRMGGRRNAVASNSGSDHFSDDTTKGITSVSIGDIEGGIQNSTIAGRDIIQTNVTFPSTSNSLQKRQLNALETVWKHVTTIEDEHSRVLRWNDGDAYLPPDFDVRTYIGNLETIVTHKEEIEKLRPYLGDELFVLSFAYCLFFWELGLLKASAFTKNPFKKMEIVDWQENEKICGILNTAFTPDELDNILSQEKPSSYVVAQLLKDKIAKSIEISISSEKTL